MRCELWIKRNAWVGLALAGMLLTACDDATGPEGEAPALPAIESMEFDMGFFEGGSPTLASEAGGEVAQPQSGAGLNWAAAALSVGVANLAVVIHTAVPVATWRAAILQQPVVEDGTWHWRFSASQGGQTYAGDLAGFLEGADRVFEMRVSSSALQLNDFLWYTGRAPVGGTSGRWEFFDADAPSVVAGQIVWTHPEADLWTLTFSALAGDNPGDELRYEVDGTERNVTFYDASEDVTVEVFWDEVTHEGYIVAPGYNGGAMACWNGSLANTPCA